MKIQTVLLGLLYTIFLVAVLIRAVSLVGSGEVVGIIIGLCVILICVLASYGLLREVRLAQQVERMGLAYSKLSCGESEACLPTWSEDFEAALEHQRRGERQQARSRFLQASRAFAVSKTD